MPLALWSLYGIIDTTPPFAASGKSRGCAALSVERPRIADERITPHVEAQRTRRRASNADPFALPDFARRVTVGCEPQWALVTEIDPVQPAIDAQSCAQP